MDATIFEVILARENIATEATFNCMIQEEGNGSELASLKYGENEKRLQS